MRGSFEPLIPLNGCKGTNKFALMQIFVGFFEIGALIHSFLEEGETGSPSFAPIACHSALRIPLYLSVSWISSSASFITLSVRSPFSTAPRW